MTDQYGFEPTTATDHRAWLWVVSVLSLLYSVLCLGARLTAKWELLWWDDCVLGVAYVFAVVHYGTLFKALSTGLGASALLISNSSITSAAQYYFTSRIVALIAMCLSKLSVVMFTRRIFSGNIYMEKIWFSTAYALAVVYGLCAVLLSSAGCEPADALVPQVNAVCDGNIARWSVLTALDVISEIMLVAIPMWFIAKNQIKASKKRVVAFVFCFRLIVAAFSIVAMASYFEYLRGGKLSIGIAPTIAWQETLIGASLISASIPCLRSFLWAFMSTGLMTIYGNNTTGNSYGSQPKQSNQRSPFTSRNREVLGQVQNTSSRLRPEWMQYSVDVSSPRNKKNSIQQTVLDEFSRTSDGSDRMIIHRDVEVEIERS